MIPLTGWEALLIYYPAAGLHTPLTSHLLLEETDAIKDWLLHYLVHPSTVGESGRTLPRFPVGNKDSLAGGWLELAGAGAAAPNESNF